MPNGNSKRRAKLVRMAGWWRLVAANHKILMHSEGYSNDFSTDRAEEAIIEAMRQVVSDYDAKRADAIARSVNLNSAFARRADQIRSVRLGSRVRRDPLPYPNISVHNRQRPEAD